MAYRATFGKPSLRDRFRRAVRSFALCTAFTAAVGGAWYNYYGSTRTLTNATITSVEVTPSDDPETAPQMIVHTDKGTFTNEPSRALVKDAEETAKLARILRPGNHVDLDVYGIHFPLWPVTLDEIGIHQNIGAARFISGTIEVLKPPPVAISVPTPPSDAGFSGGGQKPIACDESNSRHMTAREAAFARAFYGIDPAPVCEVALPNTNNGWAGMAFSPELKIEYYGKNNQSGDYVADADDFRFGLFGHEVTHIAQYEADEKFTPNQGDGSYPYPLETKYRFTDYGAEQQAAMVEDYVRMFLHPSQRTRWLEETYGKEGARQKAPLLAKMIEDQFPGAAKLRAAYQANGGKLDDAIKAADPGPTVARQRAPGA
jgi:hypothetical protein